MFESIEVLIEAPPHRLVKRTDPFDRWIGVETLQSDGQWLSVGEGYKELIQSMINNLDQLRKENDRLRARIRELERADTPR